MTSRIRLQIAHYVLIGTRIGVKWRWQCRHWPDLAAQFEGATEAIEALNEFEKRAVAAVEARKVSVHGVFLQPSCSERCGFGAF